MHKNIRIVVKKEMPGVAATGGATIHVSAQFVKNHPHDVGMIVHELVHVVQAYPDPKPGWLTEGIADYVRYWHFEPGSRSFPIDAARSSYRDSYGTAARFLAWLAAAKDAKLVQKLDAAMSQGEYREAIFEESAGATLDQLWAEFVHSATRSKSP